MNFKKPKCCLVAACLMVVACQAQKSVEPSQQNSSISLGTIPNPVQIAPSDDQLRTLWPRPASQFTLQTEFTSKPTYEGAELKFRLAAPYPKNMPVIGQGFTNFANQLPSELDVELSDPSGNVKPFAIFDEVKAGKIEAGWSQPNYWHGIENGFSLLSGTPFGPDIVDFVGWRLSPDGEEAARLLYGRNNMVGLFCGVIPNKPEFWTKKNLTTLEDFNSMRLRHPGLPMMILRNVGAQHLTMSAGELPMAMATDKIQATHLSTVGIDYMSSLHKNAKNLYYPSVLSNFTAIDLMVNHVTWRKLGKSGQEIIRKNCMENVEWMIGKSVERDQNVLPIVSHLDIKIQPLPSALVHQLRDESKRLYQGLRSDKLFRHIQNSQIRYQAENDGIINLIFWPKPN